MSGVVKAVTGGGNQKSSSGGFAQLPREIKGAFNGLGAAAQNIINGGNQAFTPIGQTADETAAFDVLRGNDPTASLQTNIAAQMNPFNDSVINTINREGQGQNSVLQQSLDAAGASGSNRGILGANDIDLTRLNQIGTFQQGQFNTALQNALTTIPQGQQQYAQGLAGIGAQQRDLSTQISQADLNKLLAASKLINVLPGSAGGSTSSDSSVGGFGKLVSGAAGVAGIAALSDRRLKDNIRYLGDENGHRTYEFSYKGESGKFVGVMADEVEKTNPDAIVMMNGYKAVNYDAIGVKFREA